MEQAKVETVGEQQRSLEENLRIELAELVATYRWRKKEIPWRLGASFIVLVNEFSKLPRTGKSHRGGREDGKFRYSSKVLAKEGGHNDNT